MVGRKPIYKVPEIGEKTAIPADKSRFAHQVAYSMTKRFDSKKVFKAIYEGNKAYIIREK